MTAAKAKNVFPKLKIAIHDQKPSGYFREDTLGSPNPLQKTVADAYYIPNTGEGIRYIKYDEKGNSKELNDEEAIKMLNEKSEGWEEIVIEPYPIRYIKGCPSIDYLWQEEHGWKPRPDPKSDEICIEEGFAELEYSHDPAKYLYLKSLLWNASLPNRLDHKKKLYYEVQKMKQDDIDITVELAISEATKQWEKLVVKGKGNTFTIKEEKVNALCSMLNVQGSSPQQSLKALLNVAKTKPVEFCEKIIAYEEEAVTDVSHAIELGLINFEGNEAVFFNGKRLPLGKVAAKSSKIERTAEIIKGAEFKEQYVALKNEIQKKKEQALN